MKLKDILNESKNNISEAKKVDPRIAGDIFARYLIGDRTDAIRQLDKLKKIASFGVMETPGTKEYNQQFAELSDKITKVIRGVM
jgi:hypothetical protein